LASDANRITKARAPVALRPAHKRVRNLIGSDEPRVSVRVSTVHSLIGIKINKPARVGLAGSSKAGNRMSLGPVFLVLMIVVLVIEVKIVIKIIFRRR
jgi:hypothetical protein